MMNNWKNQNRLSGVGVAHVLRKVKIKELIMITPYVMLVIDGVSLMIYHKEWWGNALIWYLSQIAGHSILVCVGMLYFAVLNRFCLYSKISIVALLLLNTYNIIYDLFSLTNYFVYALILILTGIILSTIFFIKSCLKK